MKQILTNGIIQYRNAFIDMQTGELYTYGEDSVTAPKKIAEDLYYYDCVEKRPNYDGYYESEWVYSEEETA